MMKNKIFFFDIDGTLYNQKEIPLSTLNSLKELKNKGYYVFIATGRPEVLVYPFLKQVQPNGFIALNGGAAYLNNEKLYELFMTKSVLKELIDELVKNDDTFTLLTQTQFVSNNVNHEVLTKYVDAFKINDLEECSSDFYKENNTKAFAIHAKDFDYYFKKFPNLNFYKINDYGYEVVENFYSKGTGCMKVAQLLNVDIKDTYCFGDELNDTPMFETCGVSVAMGNGNDELKKIATHVTKHIDEDGIEYALKNILKVI